MRFTKWVAAPIVGLALAATASAGVVDLITNGSFETPVVNGFQEFSSSIPGWTGSAGIEIQANGILGAGQVTPFGNQYAELAVEAPSTYSQTVSTVAGQHYLLSFYLSARPTTGANTVQVGFTGDAAQQFTVQDSGTISFQHFTQDFIATSSQSVLSFQPVNLQSPGVGDLLDNVSLTAVSTPSAVPLPTAAWMALTTMPIVLALTLHQRRVRGRCAIKRERGAFAVRRITNRNI
jgi:hypothetical protein